MTAPAREREHGYARYKLDGCRCTVCKAARSVYDKRVTMARTAGTWRPWTEADRTREHLLALSAAGIGYRRVANLTGIGKTAVRLICEGRREKIRPDTEAKILALPLGPATLAPSALIPTVGVRRRVQALACIGWSVSDQARRIGMAPTNLPTVIRRTRVERRTDDAVRRLYDDLSMSPAPAGYSATRARNDAFRRSWFGPLAWDDDTIDDPDAFPAVMPAIGPVVWGANELAIQHVAAGHTDPRLLDYASRIEWVARMRHAEHTLQAIAAMLGVSDHTVIDMAKRAVRYALGREQVAA